MFSAFGYLIVYFILEKCQEYTLLRNVQKIFFNKLFTVIN